MRWRSGQGKAGRRAVWAVQEEERCGLAQGRESRADGGLKSALALVPQALGVLGGGQGEDQVMEEASATDRDQEAERERRLGILTVWASSF